MVGLPEPGSDLAKVVCANRMLKQEHAQLKAERDELLAIIHAVDEDPDFRANVDWGLVERVEKAAVTKAKGEEVGDEQM